MSSRGLFGIDVDAYIIEVGMTVWSPWRNECSYPILSTTNRACWVSFMFAILGNLSLHTLPVPISSLFLFFSWPTLFIHRFLKSYIRWNFTIISHYIIYIYIYRCTCANCKVFNNCLKSGWRYIWWSSPNVGSNIS